LGLSSGWMHTELGAVHSLLTISLCCVHFLYCCCRQTFIEYPKCSELIRPPGTLVPKALCFTADVFFFLFSPHDLRAPSADRRETLAHDRKFAIWVHFIMQVQKFGGPSPKKLGAKNMQNSARFQTTSDVNREYLQNGTRYPKSESNLITADSSRVPRRKSGELWSTNYR